MSTAEERADLNVNPLPEAPNCSTCLHCYVPETECAIREDEGTPADRNRCEYLPDELHDPNLPPMQQAYLIRGRIQALQEELKGYQNRYDSLLEKIVAAGIEKEGQYSLVDKKRTVRVPSVEKFKELYQEDYQTLKRETYDAKLKQLDDLLLQDLTTIPVKRAEELIGKVKLNAISEEKVYHNYKVISSEDPHDGI